MEVAGAESAVFAETKDEAEASMQSLSGKVDYDKLWYIHGQAYDLQANGWLNRHPGGSYPLLSCRGMDVTAMFEAYHPFTDKARARFASFTPVAVPDSVLKLKCADRSKSNWFKRDDGSYDPFWEALRHRCGQVVREQSIPRTISWQALAFSIFLLLCQPVAYYFGYLNANFWIALATSSLMGTTTWLGGSLLGHDEPQDAIRQFARSITSRWLSMLWGLAGGHYALFSGQHSVANEVVGAWGGLGLANISYWELLHTIMHHSDANAEGVDPDIYHYLLFLRMTASKRWNCMISLQAYKLWCYGVWSFTTAGLLMIEPLLLLLSGSGTIPRTPFENVVVRPYLRLKLVLHLIAFPTWMLALPIWYNWSTLDNKGVLCVLRFLCFCSYLTTSGLWFGVFSQMSHLPEGCIDAAAKPASWAVREVETAANFASTSVLWSVLSGGVNVQIEHHLFPGFSATRLQPLIPVVKQTCKEFNVDYTEFDVDYKDFPTFWRCLASVHRFLAELSQRDYKAPTAYCYQGPSQQI